MEFQNADLEATSLLRCETDRVSFYAGILKYIFNYEMRKTSAYFDLYKIVRCFCAFVRRRLYRITVRVEIKSLHFGMRKINFVLRYV